MNELFQKYVNVHYFTNKRDFKAKLVELMQYDPKYQRRDESMSWDSAKSLMMGVCLVSFSLGATAFLLGFPLVLPFFGLEASFFCFAFYDKICYLYFL